MPAKQQSRRTELANNPRQLYVSYLSTSAIVGTMTDINMRLIDNAWPMSGQTRATYRLILQDLSDELEGRQLALWTDPTLKSDD